MSVGLALLRCILDEGAPLTQVLSSGVNRDSFVGDEQAIFDAMSDHFRRYGVMPSRRTVENDLDFRFQRFEANPLEYWISRVRERHLERVLQDGVHTLAQHLRDGDLGQATDRLTELFFAARTAGLADQIVPLADYREPILQAHAERFHATGISGVDLGFPTLTEDLDGAQGGDLIALVGRPGTGKTYVLCRMAIAANQSNHSVMFATYEMGGLQIARRLYAMMAHVSNKLLRFGQFSSLGLSVLRASMYGTEPMVSTVSPTVLHQDSAFYLVNGSFISNLDDLHVMAQQYRPNILFVDGAYLPKVTGTEGASRTDRIAEAALRLKDMAQILGIPVIASYQFNREAAKSRGGAQLHQIYMSDAIAQLSSTVLALENDEESDTDWSGVDVKRLRVIKGREGEARSMRIRFNMLYTAIEEERPDVAGNDEDNGGEDDEPVWSE